MWEYNLEKIHLDKKFQQNTWEISAWEPAAEDPVFPDVKVVALSLPGTSASLVDWLADAASGPVKFFLGRLEPAVVETFQTSLFFSKF